MPGKDLIKTSGANIQLAASALADHGGVVGDCANCGAPLLGPYCALCGQPRDTHRRSIRSLIHNFIEDFGNFDGRVFQTFFSLLFKPGDLSCAFREGRTHRYMPAVRLYLFVSLIFFLVLSTAHIAILQLNLKAAPHQTLIDRQGRHYIMQDGEKVVIPTFAYTGKTIFSVSPQPRFFLPIGVEKQKLSPGAVKQYAEMQKKIMHIKGASKIAAVRNSFSMLQRLETDPAALNDALMTWIPRVLFLLVPLFALVLALFYIFKRKRFYMVDHLVFSLNMHSFAFVALLLAVGAAQFLSQAIVGWGVTIVLGVYFLLAMKRFYGQGWPMTAIKWFFVGAVYTCFCLAPAMGGVIALSFVD